MSTTNTTNQGWAKPDDGTETDNWGLLLNTIFDAIDALVGSNTTSGNARMRPLISDTVPASASATGVAGTICADANYIYICTATNTWKRAALSTW